MALRSPDGAFPLVRLRHPTAQDARIIVRPSQPNDHRPVMRSSLRDVPDLHRETARLLRQIPTGRITTYGDVARALGDAGAARWVGEFLVSHVHEDDCPCHRVVRVNGDVGLYITRSEEEKAARLRQDGVAVVHGRVDLKRFRFDGLRSSAPLAVLRDLQVRIPEQLRLQPLAHAPQRVGGVDVSYLSGTEAVAAFVLLELPALELVWTKTLRGAVTFPYISGYLAFRELPLLARLFDEVRAAGCEPDVTFVDGNGILHPRRAGIASAFGLAVLTPTIGVGKKLLCGRIEDGSRTSAHAQAVVHEGETVGYAVRASYKNRPFYVSPGHLTDLAAALAVTRTTLGPHRLPLPIAFADRESRREAQQIANQSRTTTP